MEQKGEAVPLNSESESPGGQETRTSAAFSIAILYCVALVLSCGMFGLANYFFSMWTEEGLEFQETTKVTCMVMASSAPVGECYQGKGDCTLPQVTVQIAAQEVNAWRYRYRVHSEIHCRYYDYDVTNTTDCVVEGQAFINQFPV